MSQPHERILFVTGRLAEPALRRTLAALAPTAGFDYEVAALGISVAALMTPDWIARQLHVPSGTRRIVLPGYCQGDLSPLAARAGAPVELGPKDLRDLPEHFGKAAARPPDYGAYDIQILAEINNVPRLALADVLRIARHYRDEGADVIDLGCDPGQPWPGVYDTVRALRAEGYRVSIDSLHPQEIEEAARAGAELVLSINGSNLPVARNLGCEVVVTPDDPATLAGLDHTVEQLDAWRVPYRIDPIIEPIGFGFAASLGRYLEVRRRYPAAPMLMGIGNLTELTDADSAALNVLLISFCQELGIKSVLTTEVINWARSSVREIDLARRLAYHACMNRLLPKHVEPRLILLRDEKLREHGPETLADLARQIKDPNFRIFAERDLLHVMNSQMYLTGRDPFDLFQQMHERMRSAGGIDPDHAFYLGYEMAKAVTALTLSKGYTQDQPLDWGFLTASDESHLERRKKNQT